MLVHLTGISTSVVVDISTGAPTIVHWGSPLEGIDGLQSALDAMTRPIPQGTADVEAPISLVPEHGSGFPGRPGLAGHRRRGTHWSPRFVHESHTLDDATGELVVDAVDVIAELRLITTMSLHDVLRVRLAVVNESADERYMVDRLDVTLPLPSHARELMRFTGRWTREMHPQRTAFDEGAVIAENRSGRTSHQHPPIVFCGTRGFGEWHGQVLGAHLAWSGNHQIHAEVLPDGRRCVQLGELLQPGEVSLLPGHRYESPEVIATFSDRGLTPASWNFHRHVRAQATARGPRPVLLNTWEAVYFDHDADRLRQLAEVAAAVGAERFVLDDGWFGSRRDDTSGLGDWTVSADAHPHGLAPVIEHVRSLGMDFGIWVEPEMVNPDSDLFRAHPEWALTTDGYEPVLARHQLVLDLARPAAFEHVLAALDVLLRDHDIAFVKWDMNRDHVQGSGSHGAAGTHEQTVALYRLIDELRRRHPGVEFESCASGGGRIDHAILQRTDRVWTSDCNDPLERQTIQRGVSMFVPPEMMGAHIGPPRSHTTGRRQSLGLRASTAMFAHLGIEWNVLTITEAERGALAEVVAVHKRFRALLHSGDVVRFDADDDATIAHGVYAPDRGEALVSAVRTQSSMSLVPAPLRLPDLGDATVYAVQRVALPDDARERSSAKTEPPWLADGATMTGRQLAVIGIQLPVMNPESAILIHLRAVG